MDKKHLLSFGIKYDMAAGFLYKRYRKGTKREGSRVMIPYKSPFYQLFRNYLYNFSTHLLTVLTISCIVIVKVEQITRTHLFSRGGVCYEPDKIYAEIHTGG